MSTSVLRSFRSTNSVSNVATGTHLNRTRSNQEVEPRRRRRNNINLILFCIVVVFLVCHIFRFCGIAYYAPLKDFHAQCVALYNNVSNACNATEGNGTMIFTPPEAHYPKWLWKLTPVAQLLLLINSSLNFIIYVLAGTRFRNTFFRKYSCIFRHFRRQPRESNGVPMVTSSPRSKLNEKTQNIYTEYKLNG